jgi:hypothetical protein
MVRMDDIRIFCSMVLLCIMLMWILDGNHAEESQHQKNHYNVTMAEFYGYRLQHRDTYGIALLRGGRLRQQYIVNAYVVVEQNCLRYLCLN